MSDKRLQVEVGVDYLRFVHSRLDLKDWILVQRYLKWRFGIFLDWENAHPSKVGRYFEQSAHSECGGAFAAVNFMNSGEADCVYQLSGKILGNLNIASQTILIKRFLDWGFHCTRIDLCLDDFAWQLNPKDIELAIANKDIKYTKVGTIVKGFYDESYTYGFGRRSSERYGRIYNKFAESKGVRNCMRLETELKGQLARKATELINSFGDDIWGILGTIRGLALSAFEFVDRAADSNINRCPQLPWWAAFLERVGKTIRVRRETIPTSVERIRDWFGHQVATSMAVLQRAYGVEQFLDWIKGEIALGDTKIKNCHEQIVQRYLWEQDDRSVLTV